MQLSEFEASVVYRVSFMAVRATQRDTVSKSKENKKERKLITKYLFCMHEWVCTRCGREERVSG